MIFVFSKERKFVANFTKALNCLSCYDSSVVLQLACRATTFGKANYPNNKFFSVRVGANCLVRVGANGN
ncbi:hypothetical protein [Capnocytophaga sp. oral taxon 323]|uniref:hypothetical protein n=1 Tax=Capnocytophaga sp. oral taxon 323 TaxID=1705617 RepID=UPI0012F9AE8B|nr:hypothetical protein [Capnocytophaga sp. oral taxon 323]